MLRAGDRLQIAIHDWILGRRFDAIRADVIAKVTGRVLEIGAGTGLNFGSYPAGVRVTAIEPSHALREKAIARSKGADIRAEIDVIDAFAEDLPFERRTFDFVVVTFVLCSVTDVTAALREMHRVLKPGGSVLLAEHVNSSDARTSRCQHRAQPVWERVFGGCSLVRDLQSDLWDAGFDVSEVAPIELPLPRLARAGIVGRALRVELAEP